MDTSRFLPSVRTTTVVSGQQHKTSAGNVFVWIGDVALSHLSYAGSLSETYGVDYAEHALILGKPTLQAMGDKLIEQQWSASLMAAVCDVDAQIDQIKNMVDSRKAYPLAFATGERIGDFVINDLNINYLQIINGKTMAAEISFVLREFVDPDTAGTRRRAAREKAIADINKLPIQTRILPTQTTPKTTDIVAPLQDKLISIATAKLNTIITDAHRKSGQILRI